MWVMLTKGRVVLQWKEELDDMLWPQLCCRLMALPCLSLPCP